MNGHWEYTLNKSTKENGGVFVTLDSILSELDKKEKVFSLNPENSTIRYIEAKEYVEGIRLCGTEIS